jgi:hypothetical protein
MIEPGDLWVRVLLAGDPEDYERILRAFQDAHEPAIDPFVHYLTVVAELGPPGLDTLIRAGFAATRAQAIRWALDRIRERPAYQRLRDLQRDTDALKDAF